jgi:hypothetical protein
VPRVAKEEALSVQAGNLVKRRDMTLVHALRVSSKHQGDSAIIVDRRMPVHLRAQWGRCCWECPREAGKLSDAVIQRLE